MSFTERSRPALLEMRGITKRFPGVLANANVDFDVLPGEVHALLGENGAGKSTLMKMLYGLLQPDEGVIRVGGTAVSLRSPADAITAGIGMVHQHFMLVPTLTVAENVVLGLPGGKRGRTELGPIRDRLAELAEAYGLQVDPDAYVWQLAVGERQRVEILKALHREANLLVLDEPTAVLTPREVDAFFTTLRTLAAAGKGIVFISHKLHEVLDLSHRVTVLRLGRVTGEVATRNTSREQLAHMMVGRDVKLAPDKPMVPVGAPRLRVARLSVMGDRGNMALKEVSLDVRSGEILGIAGVSGNGQRELAEAIAGLRAVSGGSVSLDGVEILAMTPAEVREAGIGYVPEERMRDGAIGAFTVAENLLLVDHGAPRFAERGVMRTGAIREHAERLVGDFAVKTPSIDTPVSSLSGGNIQKLILARELTAKPKAVIVSQPTRGVDIGAAEYIHARLVQARESGTATLIISEDLEEILGLADRIAVLFDGKLMAILPREQATIEKLGLLMAGVSS